MQQQKRKVVVSTTTKKQGYRYSTYSINKQALRTREREREQTREGKMRTNDKSRPTHPHALVRYEGEFEPEKEAKTTQQWKAAARSRAARPLNFTRKPNKNKSRTSFSINRLNRSVEILLRSSHRHSDRDDFSTFPKCKLSPLKSKMEDEKIHNLKSFFIDRWRGRS